MQILLHPFSSSIPQYEEEISDPNRHRPNDCPPCSTRHPLAAHGFYRRSLVDAVFDGFIRVRRYLCRFCQRTVSLLPEFVLPYLRFSLDVISRFLVARLLQGLTLKASAQAAFQPRMPYQRGQFWIRRFQKQAAALSAVLVALTISRPAANFVTRALEMLQAIGWIAAHRFLFSQLRLHLLGWPSFLLSDGRRATLRSAGSTPASPHTTLV